MAQTMKVPKFWINELEWLDYNNVTALPSEHFRTLPVNPTAFESADITTTYDLENPFCFILGHSGLESIAIEDANDTSVITTTGTLINEDAALAGWSLMELSSATPTAITAEGQIGSIIIGSSWSPPHSPDLSVNLSYDYSGVKSITTKGGSELTNSFYHGNPKWGDTLGAWELGQEDTTQNLSRSGRKIFDISFSFLSESDIFPATLNLSTEASTSLDDTLNTGTDDFYGQVIHKLGGALPFIFSPDKDSTALDNFAICKFDQNSFSFQQTAPNLYSVKMKIREVW